MKTKIFIQLIAAFLGSLGFSIVFYVPKNMILKVSLGGALGWSVYLLASLNGLNDYWSAFYSSAAAALYSEVMAIYCETPSDIFSVIATLPMIPGGSLYRAMNAAVHQNEQKMTELGCYTVLFAASMSAGIVIIAIIFRKLRFCLNRICLQSEILNK